MVGRFRTWRGFKTRHFCEIERLRARGGSAASEFRHVNVKSCASKNAASGLIVSGDAASLDVCVDAACHVSSIRRLVGCSASLDCVRHPAGATK